MKRLVERSIALARRLGYDSQDPSGRQLAYFRDKPAGRKPRGDADRELAPIAHAVSEPSAGGLVAHDAPTFMLVPPTFVGNTVHNNPWMELWDRVLGPGFAFDVELAMTQFRALHAALSEDGIVYLAPARPGLEDQTYVANAGITLPAHIAANTHVVSNYRSQPRVGEAQATRVFFAELGVDVVQPPYFFEGEADLKFVGGADGRQLIGGYGIRTQQETYTWLEERFDLKITRVRMEDPSLYHFDCLFFPIDTQNALVCVDALYDEDVRAIERVCNVIEVPKAYAYFASTNSARCGKTILNGSHLGAIDAPWRELERQRIDWFETEMSKLGYEPRFLDLSEFTKSGAALSCLVQHLNYRDYLG